jgi:hypothetical protein
MQNCLIAVGHSFMETTATLQDMMERQNRGFNWSMDHNSKFALDKLAVTHFTRAEKRKMQVTR